MLRIDKIFVKLDEKSRLTFEKVQQTLEDKLKDAASATRYVISHNDMQIEVNLEEPISLPTVNKILIAFSKERMIILDMHWKRKEIGAFRRGYLEIVVS